MSSGLDPMRRGILTWASGGTLESRSFPRQHEREAGLRRAGWTVIRTTWEELTTNPAGLIRRLLAAFAQAA